ncbi:Putative basic-leucine zipper domain-containing protein [Colletotrichum destructivum]|uniref:Basic-leucine zipper domain-containing protein n=1 Tax=Colletotrichum destructivum TaxID=34406 RepID=A0AAX4IM43_9PEZI|nr:Putative basic-leucine zipper domain-containing protein [Colletotrichum destructivum]
MQHISHWLIDNLLCLRIGSGQICPRPPPPSRYPSSPPKPWFLCCPYLSTLFDFGTIPVDSNWTGIMAFDRSRSPSHPPCRTHPDPSSSLLGNQICLSGGQCSSCEDPGFEFISAAPTRDHLQGGLLLEPAIPCLNQMAQSGHPGSALLVEARYTSLSLYDVPLSEQTPFLAPTNDYHFHQQWAGQGYQTFEPVFSLGNSAGPTDSIHWERERPSHQASEAAITTTPGYSAVSWAPWSEDWSWYQELQQNLQQSQPVVFSQPPQCPTPAASPLAMDAAWHPATSGQTRPEPDSRTTTTKKKVTMSVKEPLEPHSSSTAQHCAKRARVEAGSEPSPVTPISCVKGDNKGEDSDISRALRGPERKKTYRVKNRAAAKRCREKTTQYEMDLVNKEKQVTQERVYLDSCVTALKNEVTSHTHFPTTPPFRPPKKEGIPTNTSMFN